MTGHWLPHAASGLLRAGRVRWATRAGFTVGETPAFHPDAVEWFRAAMGKATAYIEYGSGASTLWAARAGIATLSMEADPRYAAAVRAALPPGAPVEVMDGGIGLTAEWSYPVFTRPTARRLKAWRNYAQAPLARALDEGWVPDLVLVDGRFRRSCALHAAAAIVRAGGIATLVFDDYVNRRHYQHVEAFLGVPRIIGLTAVFAIDKLCPFAGAGMPQDVLTDASRDVR